MTFPWSWVTVHRQTLRSPGFRQLWIAALVSRAGDAINFVALPIFALEVTGSPVAVGALVIVEVAGLIVGGSTAQLVVDRTPPRRLLVGMDVSRAVTALALALVPSYPTALVVAGALAIGTSWFSPASAALVPRLVDARSLPSANALMWGAGVVLQLIAAPVGGFLAGSGAARVAFGLNALSFVGSAILLTRLPHLPGLAVGTSPWRQLPEALRTVRTITIMPPLLLTQALAALAVGGTSALLVVLAQRAYGLSGAGYGAWLAAIGVGGLIGPLVSPVVMRLAPSRVIGGAYLVRSVGDILLGVLGSGWAGGLLLSVYGVNTSTGAVAFQTLVQRDVPEALRGRAFALLDVTWQSGRLISIAVAGMLAATLGIRVVFVVGGSLLLLAGVIGLTLLRSSRPTDRWPSGETCGTTPVAQPSS
jgi:predicted MFS family arabinose efflux permease